MLTQNRILREVATTTPGMRILQSTFTSWTGNFKLIWVCCWGIPLWTSDIVAAGWRRETWPICRTSTATPEARQGPVVTFAVGRWKQKWLGILLAQDLKVPRLSVWQGICAAMLNYSIPLNMLKRMYVCPRQIWFQASPQSTCWKEVMRRNPSPDLSLPSRFKLLTHKHTKHLVLCLKPECGSLRGMIPSIWQVLRTNHCGDSGHQGLSDSFC